MFVRHVFKIKINRFYSAVFNDFYIKKTFFFSLQFCISSGFPGYGWDNPCGFCSIRIAAANYSASIYIGAKELHIDDKYCMTINIVSQMGIENKNVPEDTECTIDLKQGAQINVVKLSSTYTLNLVSFL